MSITASLSVTSFFRNNFRTRKLTRRGGSVKVQERSLLSLVCDFNGSDSGEDNDCAEINVECPPVTDTCCHPPCLWKIDKEENVSMSMRGSVAESDDVDHLVELINLNSLRHQPNHVANPKKAAKKARQKARKEEEKRLKLEAENALREAEERKKLAEEQLEKQMRNLNVSKKSSKNASLKECLQMKENKNVAQGLLDFSIKRGNKNSKGINKGPTGYAAETKGKGLSLSNQRNHVCAKPCCIELELQPSKPTTPPSSGRKNKKKKKQIEEIHQPQPQVEYCSHICSSHPSCGVPPPIIQPVVQGLEDDPNSAKSKKARKKARQQLRRAQLASNNNNGSLGESTQLQAIQSCNYGQPVVINVPNPPFSMTPMVRSKPDAVDIDTFIADPVDKSGQHQKRPSKKKRNKKKSSLKVATEGASQPVKLPDVVDLGKAGSRERDIVTCTPVLHPPSCGESVLLQHGPRIPSNETVKPRISYSLFNELDDGAEIDLTKLKLPPGITITKVNQPVSSFAGLGQVDEDKHSNSNTETSYANPSPAVMVSSGHTTTANASAPSLYYSDGFHSKPNVIVVDSQEYNGDNESDAEDFVGFKKRPNKFEEVVSVKVKRLRNRVNRYLYGDDPSSAPDRHENIPEKILTPAQASVYLNQHIPANRVKHQAGELNGETCPRNSSNLQQAGSLHTYSDPQLIPTSISFNRSSSCGSKRKQPLTSSCVRHSRPKELFQQQPVGQPVFPGGLNFSSSPFEQSQNEETSVSSNPFVASYQHTSYPVQASCATNLTSPLDQKANINFEPPPTQMNGYGSWAPPVRPSIPSTNSVFGAHRDYVNQPFFFRSHDSH
ncbi:unnamed protein product [Allacma fusca]|uniref:Uncharacterized protein n=1 Tax=Allacma fusca TaxID=39272 RepID=A0A8J2PAF1_9HEXA|nr:unnamed protein product [Allacma fusca]